MLGYLKRLIRTGAAYQASDILSKGVALFTLPLYTRYVDVFDAAAILADILRHRQWDRPEFKRRPRNIAISTGFSGVEVPKICASYLMPRKDAAAGNMRA